MRSIRAHGKLDARFNLDKTQVVASIYPTDGGEPVQYEDVIENLRQLGVLSGIREPSIRDAIQAVNETGRRAVDVVIAQGTLPEQGKDGSVRFLLPAEELRRPLPMHPLNFDIVNWFELNTNLIVKPDTDLVALIPPTTGQPGKTLTLPPANVPVTAGKPPDIRAGNYVAKSEDGLRLVAQTEGFVLLNGNVIEILPLCSVQETIVGKQMEFKGGAILCADAMHSTLRMGDFLAARGKLINCKIRCFGDVFLSHAEDCEIVTTGNLYISGTIHGCQVTVRGKVMELGNSFIVGGCIRASHGIAISHLGDESKTFTEVKIGEDYLTGVRVQEIREELDQCEANIKRISQILRPFVSVSVHSTLDIVKRALLQQLQNQQQTQQARVRTLHNEKRAMTMEAHENYSDAAVNILGTIHPSVRVHVRTAMTRIECPYSNMQFVEGVGGKWVRMQSLQKAA